MIPPRKVQVPGFSNADTHKEVIIKGANGLGIEASPERFSLIISNGLVLDSPLPSGLPWNLGNYTNEFGGVQARGKRTFGIFMPYDVADEEVGASFSNSKGYLPIKRRMSYDNDSNSKQSKCEDRDIIIVDSGEIPFDDSTSSSFGTYSPMSGNKVVTCVSVKGREGVWRILTGNYHSAEEDVSKELNEILFEQPESQGFFLTEVYSDGVMYLKAQINGKGEIDHKEINFHLKEKRLVHSQLSVTIMEDSVASLLTISLTMAK